MADRAVADTDKVLYDIHLRRRLPDSLRSRFPSLICRTTGPQTALRRQVAGPAQLDAMLQRLCSVGLVLTDLHRLPPAVSVRPPGQGSPSRIESAQPDGGQAQGATYELRVQGELGATLLRYLRWSHYVVPEQTQVRLVAAPVDLHRFLQACTDCGAIIERVRRVGSGTVPSRASRELSGA